MAVVAAAAAVEAAVVVVGFVLAENFVFVVHSSFATSAEPGTSGTFVADA